MYVYMHYENQPLRSPELLGIRHLHLHRLNSPSPMLADGTYQPLQVVQVFFNDPFLSRYIAIYMTLPIAPSS